MKTTVRNLTQSELIFKLSDFSPVKILLILNREPFVRVLATNVSTDQIKSNI